MEKDVAILMADLTGYTAMTDVHGGASAAKLVNKYMDLVDKSRFGTTQVVQRIGDQVVMMSEEPQDIIVTMQQLNASTVEEHHFLSIHAGINYGTIFLDNGNLFGSTINVASRIMNLANSGQVLCSSAFVNIVQSKSDASFRFYGKHRLKNVMNEIEVFELDLSRRSSPFYTDPVCHMLVDPSKANHFTIFNGTTFHFCSDHCMEIFKLTPEQYRSLQTF